MKIGQHDKFDMSYVRQEDDKSEKLWSKINGKFYVFSDFELLIVECGFQDEGQIALGDMFTQVNMKEYVSSRIAKRLFSLWKQEDESKQLVGSKAWNRGRRVGIDLRQVIAKDKEDYRGCESIIHKQVLFLIQRRFEYWEFILNLQLKIGMSSSVKFNRNMEEIEQGPITKIFAAGGQYVVKRLYVLVSNKKQFSFEIGRILLKILDRWMVKTTKVMSMRNCQSQQVKERWKDIQDNIKEMVYR